MFSQTTTMAEARSGSRASEIDARSSSLSRSNCDFVMRSQWPDGGVLGLDDRHLPVAFLEHEGQVDDPEISLVLELPRSPERRRR